MYRKILFQKQQIRGFKRITVTNPRNIKLLNISRKFLITVGAIYGAGITVAAGVYFYTTHTLEKIQPIPQDWTWKQKLMALAGANHHEEQRYPIVTTYYEKLINELVFPDDKMIDINEQTPQWLAGYADVAIRLGLSQEALGQREEAKDALFSGLSIPYGQKTLKNKAAVQLGKFELEDNNYNEAEKLFKEAIEYVSTLKGDKVEFINPLSDEQVTGSMELGKLYVQQKKLKQAFTLFLSLYKSLEEKDIYSRIDGTKCYTQTTMSYISEILWALGNKKDGLIWGEASYHDSIPKSKQSVECGLCAKMAAKNTSIMYKNMKMDNEYQKFKQRAEDVQVLIANPSRFESIWSELV